VDEEPPIAIVSWTLLAAVPGLVSAPPAVRSGEAGKDQTGAAAFKKVAKD